MYGWIEGRSLLDGLRDNAFLADRFEAAGAASRSADPAFLARVQFRFRF